METFDEASLHRSLARLAPWKQVAFMASTCERMLPNFDRFAAESGVGDPRVLRRGLDAVWSWVESDRAPDELGPLQDEVEWQAPNTESFSSPFTSAALDAANAVAIALDAVGDPDSASAVEVAGLARDTIDLHVQEVEDLDPNAPGLQKAIRRHPLMQAELRRQREDFAYLELCTGLRADAVRRLRAGSTGGATGSLATGT